MDACRAALSLEGVTIPRSADEMIRAAYSTVALPKTLGLVANVSAMEGYLMSRQSWRPWCKIGSVSDFKSHTRVRVTDSGDLKKVGNQGELEHGSKGEEFETVQADTYGKLFTVSRQDIRNDNLDSITKTPQQFGAKANTKITDLVYTLLLANGNMSDGTALFHADHNNLVTSNALSSSGLAAAIKSFRNQTNLDGDPVDIDPAWMLVPPNLENTARGLLESDLLLLTGSTDSTNPNSNIYKGALGLVVEPRMENSGFSGNSTTTWYLEADPGMNDTIEVAFLDGNEGPIVEQFDQVPSTLGRTYRVYMDVGVAALDFRTQNKNTA
ncbi:MAG: Mu-like prophage major head subunit gpT family protein [Planctomycetes bacterium]|nr:Mu-like prophage major head subunit gpT family protein [Planctomycetota bacterium]